MKIVKDINMVRGMKIMRDMMSMRGMRKEEDMLKAECNTQTRA